MNLKLAASKQLKQATLQFQVRCGGFFQAKRVQANKTEQEVANFLKVSVEALRDYESGKEGIPLSCVYSLSNCLSIPSEEIMELHLDFEEQACLKRFGAQEFFGNGDIGETIRCARETVFLTVNEIAELVSSTGDSFSIEDVLLYENGGKEPPIDFWKNFCRLTHLHHDALDGYSRWLHLDQVSTAFNVGEIRFPLREEILKALDEHQAAREAKEYKSLYLIESFS